MAEGPMRLPRERVFVPDGGPLERALERTTHLGVVAHADDLEILAYHGILSCYRDPRLGFSGVVVTDGAGSIRVGPFAGLSAQELARVRLEEQERAASIGRYAAVAMLGHTSAETRELERTDIDQIIVEILERTRPRVVYTHSLFDRHDSHVAVALRTLRALSAVAEDARPEVVLGVEVWGDLDWLPDAMKVRLDVGGEPGLEEALLAVFDSQVAAKRYDRAVVGRRLAHATFSESHEGDRTDRVVFAIDLAPLLSGEAGDPIAYSELFLDAFRGETRARLERLLASG